MGMSSIFRHRYNLLELRGMLAQLKRRADSFDNWASEVRQSLEATAEDKVCKSKFSILRWLSPALSQILPTPSPVYTLEFEQSKCLVEYASKYE